MKLRVLFLLAACALLMSLALPHGARGAAVANVAMQPLMAQVDRVEATLGYLGQPLAEQDRERIKAIAAGRDTGSTASQVEAILDKYVLAVVTISSESRVDVKRGPGRARTDSERHPVFSGKGHQPTRHHRSACSQQPQQRPGLHHVLRRPRTETTSDCIRRGPALGGYFPVRPSSDGSEAVWFALGISGAHDLQP